MGNLSEIKNLVSCILYLVSCILYLVSIKVPDLKLKLTAINI